MEGARLVKLVGTVAGEGVEEGGREEEEEEEKQQKQKSLVSFLSKEKRSEPITLIVDHREKGAELVEELRRLGACLEFMSLKVGDYVVSENVAIERKSFDDFVNSILDRRLFQQATALKEAYQHPFLLLEGRGPSKRAVAEEALRGAIVSVILDFGLPVIWAESPLEGAKIILTLAKRERREGGRSISVKDRPRPKTPDGEKEYVVSSLPFVEVATARRLLEAFGTVQGVFTADDKQLMEVDGIGPKKAKRIRELLQGTYGVRPSTDGPCQGSRIEKTES